MSALDQLATTLQATDVMQQVLSSTREDPARLLGQICREYEKRKNPVSDHSIALVGYMGEVSLKALVSAGLITRSTGGSRSLYCYEPTAEGLRQHENLKAEGFYTHLQPSEKPDSH